MAFTMAQSAEAEQFMMNLCKTPVSTICTDTINVGYRGDVVTVRENDSVHEACNALCDEEISSAPVIDAFGHFTGEFVTMLDFCEYYSQIFKDVDSPVRFTTEYDIQRARYREHRRRPLRHLLMERKAKTPVKAQRSIGVDFSLYTAVEMMAKSGPTCPSLAVVDRQNNVVGVLTTSMIIQQLHTNSKALKQLLDMPVSKMTGYGDDVLTVNEKETAIDGFRRLAETKHCCAAIVDSKTGVVADVLSQRDLKCLAPNSHNYRFLWEKLERFKAHVRERFPGEKKSSFVVCVSQSETIGKVLALYNDESIHNVFVCKSAASKVPVKCISQHDVIRFIGSAVAKIQVGVAKA